MKRKPLGRQLTQRLSYDVLIAQHEVDEFAFSLGHLFVASVLYGTNKRLEFLLHFAHDFASRTTNAVNPSADTSSMRQFTSLVSFSVKGVAKMIAPTFIGGSWVSRRSRTSAVFEFGLPIGYAKSKSASDLLMVPIIREDRASSKANSVSYPPKISFTIVAFLQVLRNIAQESAQLCGP